MVFESNAAPVSHAQFIDWYEHQTEWAEGHSYDDPVVSTEKLRAFYMEIIQPFPPLNGPLSHDDLPEDEASATDYSVGKSVILQCARFLPFDGSQTSSSPELTLKNPIPCFSASWNAVPYATSASDQAKAQ
jgi:hypothetical protein